MPNHNILIVDDEPAICNLLAEMVSKEGYFPFIATSGNEALKIFYDNVIDLVLLDLILPDFNGIELLERFKRTTPNVSVIIVSGQKDIPTVVEAVKRGAEYYITKPFSASDTIIALIKRALINKSVRDENVYLKSQLDIKSQFPHLIGTTSRMLEIFQIIKKIAPLDIPVLLVGETGTGKEVLANVIHKLSRRAEQKFISINCGALPETLLESSLFGYEKGAFTGAYKTTRGIFEEADGGTLFLDEIGETSPALQVKLLRVLQDGTFQRVGGTNTLKTDVRIISATNQDLQQAIKNKTFREDLYYRLNVITIFVPSLRERLEDLPIFIKYFLEFYSQKMNKNVTRIDEAAFQCLRSYHWPGNIRELQNVIERAVALSEGGVITLNELPEHMVKNFPSSAVIPTSKNYREALRDFEKQYFQNLLSKFDWNIRRAASAAGIPRQSFYRKIKQYGIKRVS